MPITHIFFDLHGTMVNSNVLGACTSRERARWLAAHYGGELDAWLKAETQVIADWDAYHADLNFSGDDGMRDYYEAGFRIVRALFRVAGASEPSREEIHRLARELPGITPLACDALYADVKPVVCALAAEGYILGVTTHSLAIQAHAILVGGVVRECFTGPLIGADTAEQFDKDAAYYALAVRLAKTSPESCLVVDDFPGAIEAAHRAGLKTIYIQREGSSHTAIVPEAAATLSDLMGFADVLVGLQGKEV
jgi:FMN phosphatase YigB (HAD superfamily)